MATKNIWITVVGFFIAGIGFFALILGLVGIQLTFLTWLDSPGRLFGFLAKLIMILIGIIMIYLNNSDFKGEV